MASSSNTVLDAVRKALGRTETPAQVPEPPAIPEPITRLVHSDFGLGEMFAARAKANAMKVELVELQELPAKLIAFLRDANLRTLALPNSALLEKIGLPAALREAGFELHLWGDLTLDALYDVDCAVTDVYRAVAETGSLVIRGSDQHGRSLSLVPAVHVVILEPKNIVPDLVDLFAESAKLERPSNLVIIGGPSKTADIELNLVTGVHGPGVVQAFVLK